MLKSELPWFFTWEEAGKNTNISSKWSQKLINYEVFPRAAVWSLSKRPRYISENWQERMGMVSEIQDKNSLRSCIFHPADTLSSSSFYICAFFLLFPQPPFALATSPFKKIKKLTLGCKLSYVSSCPICEGTTSRKWISEICFLLSMSGLHKFIGIWWMNYINLEGFRLLWIDTD